MRLRQRRTSLGLSLEELAQRIGCTRQQVHNYENALNRIPATRLYFCAKELYVPLEFFFEGQAAGEPRESRREHMTLELILAFDQIRDPDHRAALVKIVHQLAKASTSGGRGSGSE